jgi:hypothetical protein
MGVSMAISHVPIANPQLGRLPRNLKTAELLVLIGRTGALAPEQLAALVAHCLPAELTARDIIQIDSALERLRRRGLVGVSRAQTTLRVLRTAARRLYRSATSISVNPAPEVDRQKARRILAAMSDAAMPLESGWVEESDIHAVAYSRTPDRHYVRYELRRLSDNGLLESRLLREPRLVPVATLTPAGRRRAELEDARQGHTFSSLSDRPREDELVHHLLVIETVLRILQRNGSHLGMLRTDVALRRRSRRGRRTRLGDILDPLPDAELAHSVDDPDGSAGFRHETIEVVTSKYSNREIEAKYQAKWAPTALFTAPTNALCDRVERLVGRRPESLEASRPAHDVATIGLIAKSVTRSELESSDAAPEPEPSTPSRRRRYHARFRAGPYDAEIVAQVAGYHVLLVRQIVEHLRGPGGRVSRSARYRTVGRLIRRGFLAKGQIPGSTGHGVLHVVSVTEIGRDLLSAQVAATAARTTPLVLASTVLRDYWLQFAEVMATRFAEGWRYVPSNDVGELFHSEAWHRTPSWERRELSIFWQARPIALPALHNPATHEVRLLLTVDESRRYVRRLADLSKLAIYRKLDLELVCTAPAREARARRRIERWAKGHPRMQVQVHCLPHCTLPRRHKIAI